MEFQSFTDGAIAADGGTLSCRAILSDGRLIECGLDARIPKNKEQRLIFVGAGYPTLPEARILGRGSSEELELISALQDYVRLVPSDELAATFLSGVIDR